jgi:hypothetical protein
MVDKAEPESTAEQPEPASAPAEQSEAASAPAEQSEAATTPTEPAEATEPATASAERPEAATAPTEPAEPATATAPAEPGEAASAPADQGPPLVPDHESGQPGPGGKSRHGSRAWRIVRSVVAITLIVIGVLCLVLSPIVIWGRNLVLNTDRYVDTLAPLATNPGLQNALVTAINRQVQNNIDVKPLLNQNLPPKAANALAGPVQGAVNGLVNTVTTQFVQSKAFPKLWNGMNRVTHQQIVHLLTGKPYAKGAIKVTGGRIELDLSQLVQNVKDQLVARGITVAKNVPVTGATIEIAKASGLGKAQTLVRALNTIADWLPLIGLALVAAGIALARRWRRALIGAALGLAAGVLLILIGLLIGRTIYLSELPGTAFPKSTSAFVYDTLVRYLRLGLRLVLLVALLIALGAWVTGSSSSARAVQRWFARLREYLGQKTGPVPQFVGRHAMALRIGVVGVGLIILLLIDGPSLGTIILLAVIVVILLLVVELLRAPGGRPAGGGASEPSA